MNPLQPPVKVLGGVFIVGTLVVAVGALATQMSHTTQHAFKTVIAENMPSLIAGPELEVALLNQKGLVSSYLLSGDQRWLQLLEERRRSFDEWLGKAQAVSFTTHEQDIMQRLRSRYQEYDRLRYNAIALYQQGESTTAQQLLLGRGNELMNQLYEDLEELVSFNEQQITDSDAQATKKLEWFNMALWSTIASAILLGLAGGWVIWKGVTRRLVQSEKLASLGQLAGMVAHEVRNPLTAIKMRLHAFQEELVNLPSTLEDVEVIQEEVERLERIVKNFLSFAKLPEPIAQPVSINDILTRTLSVVKPTLEAHGIRLETRFAEPPPTAQADATQLQQVFLNLFMNSLQAMPQGGTLQVATTRTQHPQAPHPHGHVEIAIRDTGPGIPASLRRRVFDPFFTTKSDGIGLGLSLAKRIVDAHKGSIALQDGSGWGGAIVIRLPSAEVGTAVA